MWRMTSELIRTGRGSVEVFETGTGRWQWIARDRSGMLVASGTAQNRAYGITDGAVALIRSGVVSVPQT